MKCHHRGACPCDSPDYEAEIEKRGDDIYWTIPERIRIAIDDDRQVFEKVIAICDELARRELGMEQKS